MEFLKKFFSDDDSVIGLCGFKQIKPKYYQTPVMEEVFFNPFESKRVYETNFSKNVFLSV